MRDGDRIQRLQGMDESNTLPILLYNSKELSSVGGIRRLIDTRVYFLSYNLTEFLQLSPRDWNSFLYPWLVFNHRNLHRREEVMSETSPFLVIPGEGLFLFCHEVV